MAVASTKSRALVEGLDLIQRFGFNGFSFQDIGDALGFTKQSLYVHFKNKEELVNGVIELYRATTDGWAETVAVFEPIDQIAAWFEEIGKFSGKSLRYCPMSALTADYNSLPKSAQKNLNETFEAQKRWMRQTIKEGQKRHQIRADIKSDRLAESVMAWAFGGQTMARIANDAEQTRRRKVDALAYLKNT